MSEDNQTTATETSLLDDGNTPSAPSGDNKNASFVSSDGTFSDGWTSTLPEDAVPYRETLAKYKSVPELARALANANHLIGKKLGVPSEKSTPEEVAAYRKALGVPDDVAQYDFTPEKEPEGFKWDKEAMKPFAAVAHKHNIPPAAMKEMAQLFAEYESGKIDVVQGMFDAQRQEAVQSLKKEWGDKFAENISVAKQAAKLSGVNSDSFGFADPEVVRGFVRMAQMMSEDKVGRFSASPDMMSAKARAMDVMTNKDNPWHERYQNGDREAVELVNSLLKNG